MSTVKPDLTVAEAILRRRSLEKQIEEAVKYFSATTGLQVAEVRVERLDITRANDETSRWMYCASVKVALDL